MATFVFWRSGWHDRLPPSQRTGTPQPTFRLSPLSRGTVEAGSVRCMAHRRYVRHKITGVDMNDTAKDTATAPTRSRRPVWLLLLLVGAAVTVDGTIRAVGRDGAEQSLPDLVGMPQRPLPTGALQVQDMKSDPKGFTGSILVRGVVAVMSPQDQNVVLLIDSREARVCRDLQCAKFYLPMRVDRNDLSPWDEVDVRGTMTENARMVYLKADTVVNLGSIKR